MGDHPSAQVALGDVPRIEGLEALLRLILDFGLRKRLGRRGGEGDGRRDGGLLLHEVELGRRDLEGAQVVLSMQPEPC
jgi:hypothetical protein